MKALFQRRSPLENDMRPARLTLGAFGKHPGWDDHILGIGSETEALAQLKHALYVEGIGSHVDSGAWEKLEPEKRLPGFEHTFLLLRPGHVLLGQMWSSSDGKGRTKYPMVLCVDGEGVSPGFTLNVLLAGLERLRAACEATKSDRQVADDCRAGQEQLRGLLVAERVRLLDPGPPLEARRRFLECPQFGPGHLGFHRALHALNSAPAPDGPRTASGRPPRARGTTHLRLPIGGNSTKDGLQLWAALLRCIVPEPVPLLLLVRSQQNWLDVLINEPAPGDFFCLQAAPKALPLTTEIPYQLGPESKERWAQIEQSFLRAQATPSAPASLRPAAPVQPPPAAAPRQAQVPAVVTAPRVAPAPRRSPLPLIIVGALIIILIAAAFWFLRSSKSPQALPLENPGAATPAATNAPAPTGAAASQTEQGYEDALAAARAAQQNKDYSNAIVKSQLALDAKPGDPAATALLEKLKKAATRIRDEREGRYQDALNAAARALLLKQFLEVTNQAGVALINKPGDPAALKLLGDAQTALQQAARRTKQQFSSSTNAAALAFADRRFADAVTNAAFACLLCPDDPTAARLLSDYRAALEEENKFESATNAAAAAFSQGDYPTAIRQTAVALTIRTNQSVLQLQTRAREGLDLQAARNSFEECDYAKAADICQSHPDAEAFKFLASQIAGEQHALADARLNLTKGDYAFIEILKAKSYAAKAPFAALVTQGLSEQAILAALGSLKQTNNVPELKRRLASPELASLLVKPPFAVLKTWADSRPAVDSPEQVLARLDEKLEVMLVQFGVLKPTATEIASEKARLTKPLGAGVLDNPERYLNAVLELETEYKKGGWLDRDNRARNIDKLRERINLRF